MQHKYTLEKYKLGGSNRYTCPSCGKRRCFTKYINSDTNEYIDDSCGKCDHECSCGYHYTPKEFFHDHPEAADNSQANYRPAKSSVATSRPKPICTIPPEYVKKCHSMKSVFIDWLNILANSPKELARVYEAYAIGATRDGGVIFWQVDINMKVRTGKIMHYGVDGKRKGNPNWVHTKLIYNRIIPDDWTLSQCFFGEHLLNGNTHTVCIVESEKTAIVMSLFYPQYVWIATGGCSMLNADKCKVLKGRKVIVYPDSGKLDEWTEKMKATDGFSYTMVKDLEAYPGNTDIADLLIDERLPFPPIDLTPPPF